MSENKSVEARVASIIQKIDDIGFVIGRHGGITQALNDREGQPAILMLLEAIAEQIRKIETKNKRQDIIEKSSASHLSLFFLLKTTRAIKMPMMTAALTI